MPFGPSRLRQLIAIDRTVNWVVCGEIRPQCSIFHAAELQEVLSRGKTWSDVIRLRDVIVLDGQY